MRSCPWAPRGVRAGLGLCWVAWLSACASIPKGQFGVEELEIEGAEQLSEDAIKRCLLTLERSTFGIKLGFASEDCQAPPFDATPPSVRFWSWPWSEWSGLNSAVLDVDKARIERFYRARGFYDARVLEVRYQPAHAGDGSGYVPPGACDPSGSECTVSITVVVDEGAPVRVGKVDVSGLEGLSSDARAAVREAQLPTTGERFDEIHHDRAKEQLVEMLAEAAHPQATVDGRVVLDHGRKLAHVAYTLHPGPAYQFGEVRVSGHAALPIAPIVAAASVPRGEPFRQSALRDVQREIYALGAFSAVEVEREPDPRTHVMHLRVKVTPLDYDAFRLGIGVTSGAMQRTETGAVESIPQWDIHLLTRYERRHVLGTLGKLRLEDRPRLIFGKPFPQLGNDQVGNILRVVLTEPGLIEARTTLSAEALWDYGPDPFLGFLRSDIILRLGAERGFLRRRLFARLALQFDRYLVPSGQSITLPAMCADPIAAGEEDGAACEPVPLPSSYVYTFAEQELQVDLRDDMVRPRLGAYASVRAAESVRMELSDWTSVRLVPDLRVYLPLPFQMVLAARLTLGMLFILDVNPALDPISRVLGPNAYRLRGGGAQGNRGFIAGELGVGNQGGIRRWESSLELRVRLGADFGIALFYDMGDVNDEPHFRFDEYNPSAGLGMRYLTPVGTIRADLGFRLTAVDSAKSEQFLFGAPGALHMTIGEAF